MRKPFIFILALALAYVCWGQCGYESIGGGGSGVAERDTSIVGMIVPRCTACPTYSCAAWQMPDSFNGDLYFTSPNTGTIFSIQITTGCDFLLYDTCGAFPPNGTIGQFILRYAYFGQSQVVVCGLAGDTVVLDCKSTPSPQEELGPPYLDLNTCNTPAGIPEPTIACIETCYYDIVHCRAIFGSNRRDLPSGLYWEWCGSMDNGRKILISR